jgi:hypothetical protein
MALWPPFNVANKISYSPFDLGDFLKSALIARRIAI